MLLKNLWSIGDNKLFCLYFTVICKKNFWSRFYSYANSKSIIGLRLIPIYLYPLLPIGITLTSISGKEIVFNGSNIDTDTMQGYMSWGIKPKK